MQIISCQRSASAKCLESSGATAGQDHLDLANQAYDARAFEAALREYRLAYDLCRSAMVLYGIAHSEWELGGRTDAAHGFERFLREATDAENYMREDATASLRMLASQLTVVDLVGLVAPAAVLVDGRAPGGWKLGIPLYLTPGAHTVRIERAPAGPIVHTLNAAIGGRLRWDVSDVPAPAPPSGEPTPRRRWWLWGGLATLLVAGAVTGYLVTRPDRPPCPNFCP